jgi:HlyD family secretion protein
MRKYLTRRNIAILLGVLIVGVVIYLLVRKPELPEGLIQVNGRIEGDTVVISSKYNGKITQLLAREGDTVTSGEMVARLDDPETRARLAQAEHNLTTMIAQARSAGQNIGLTSETGTSGIEQAQGQVAQAQSGISDAQAAAASAQADVKNAEAAMAASSSALRQARESVNSYSAAVETARSNWQSAEKTVAAQESQAKLSKANAARFTNLAKEGVVTERQRDEYVTAAAKDQAQLQSAIATAASYKAQIASSQSDLRKSRDQVVASTANLASAKAQLSAAKQTANAAQARIQVAQGKESQALGILRQAQTSPTQVAISKSQHAGSLAQIREAQAQVAEERGILNSLYVASPINGVIVDRIRDTGEVVTAGSPILEVVDLNKLYLKAYVPENQIGKVRLGLRAQVYVDAYPNQPFGATVRYISSQAEFTPKEVQTPDERIKLVYAVKLYLDKNPDNRLTPGMPADAIIRWKEGVPWRRPVY